MLLGLPGAFWVPKWPQVVPGGPWGVVGRPQIRNFIIENVVPDLGYGRVGWWGPCLDEVVGFVLNSSR